MQFYGFVPRMLLGAMFGYLAAWSGCLWLAVIAHVTNNTLVIIAQAVTASGGFDVNQVAADHTPLSAAMAAASLIATLAIMALIRKCGLETHS